MPTWEYVALLATQPPLLGPSTEAPSSSRGTHRPETGRGRAASHFLRLPVIRGSGHTQHPLPPAGSLGEGDTQGERLSALCVARSSL